MGAKTFPPGSEQKPNFLQEGLKTFYEIAENQESIFFNPKIMNFAQKFYEKGKKNLSKKQMQIAENIYSHVTNGANPNYKISEDPLRDIWINTNQNLEKILEKNKRITISGEAGSGKGTLTKFLKDWLGYEVWSMGDMRRSVAEEHGLTIQELNEIGKKEFWTDQETDKFQKELGKGQNLIAEGRLSWYFMNSLKIYIDAEFETRVDRIHKDQKRYSEVGESTYDQVREETANRKIEDLGRYRQYYRINPFDQNHYDLILDTSKKSPEKVFETIIENINPNYGFLKSHNEDLP